MPEQTNKGKATWIAVLAVIGVGLVWLFTLWSLQGEKNPGVFGDMFGGANALFSGFAFAGLIYAILLQHEELKLQRKELIQTRQELSGQREAQEAQNNYIEGQIFDNTFFQFLQQLEQEISRLSYGRANSTNWLNGHEASKHFAIMITNELSSGNNKDENEIFKICNGNSGGTVLLYISLLEIILTLIDQRKENGRPVPGGIDIYISTVKSVLTTNEKLILFYYAASHRGQKMKKLLKKFNYFDDTLNGLGIPEDHLKSL